MLRAKQLAAKYEEEKKQRMIKKKKEQYETSKNQVIEQRTKKEQYETSTNRAIEQRTKKNECETSTNREIERSASLSRRELRWRQQQFLEYRSLLVDAELKLVTLSRTRSWSPAEAGYHPKVSQPGQRHEGK